MNCARFLGVITAVCLMVSLPCKAAPDQKPVEVIRKIRILHSDPNAIQRWVVPGRSSGGADKSDRPQGLAEGTFDLLAYPQDKSILIWGTRDAIQRFTRGVRVIDVEQMKNLDGTLRVAVRPESFKPEEFRALSPKLSNDGKARAEGKELILEGPEAWVGSALRRVMELEVAAMNPAPKP